MTPRCPSPVDLERAYWCDDAEVRDHARACPRCAPAWVEIAALVDAGRELVPAPSSPQRREELRTTILATLQPTAAAPVASRRRWAFLAPMAAAAAVLLAWWGWSGSQPTSAPASAGQVLEHPGARYQRAGAGADEIVRLIEGTLSLQVDPVPAGARFRVITGDAEVEARGSAFDVTAAADRLVAVRVIEGEVEIRSAGQTRRLVAGETWRAELLADAPAPAPLPAPLPAPAPLPPPLPAPEPPAVATRPSPSLPRRRATPHADADAVADAAEPSSSQAAPQRAFDEGFAAIRGGDYHAAAAAFARAAASGDPGVVEDARYWRAVALARAGQPGRAIPAFEAFLADHPDAARAGEASVMLGWLLIDRGDHAGAGRRFRGAARDPSARVRRSAAEGLRAAANATPR